MRKYLTVVQVACQFECAQAARDAVGTHTVVDLLQGNDRVWGKALLGVLIE